MSSCNMLRRTLMICLIWRSSRAPLMESATIADRRGDFPREEHGPRLQILLDGLSRQGQLEESEPE